LSTQTIWERAAEAEGTTQSEQYLTRLGRKAFLSLWSYSNPYSDEGRINGKGDGKELCDLLIVFGNNVLLFSDKHCEFPSHADIQVAWSRWYKNAIDKSARQLSGAEKFLRVYPNRIFLDKQCQHPLPIEIPSPESAKYFLIAVTRGSYEAGEKYWGGGSSGSLMLDSSLEGKQQHTKPFVVGHPIGRNRFVHVLDELTLDALLGELDTVPDLVSYLECKEKYFSKQGLTVTAAGEEQLLARYICTLIKGEHGLPEVPKGTDYVGFVEGDWEYYSQSQERKAKIAADSISYMWDSLIEYQSGFIRAGTALSLLPERDEPTNHELVVRALADESRLSRRQLATHLRYALSQSQPGHKFSRVVLSPRRPERAYVFLTIPKPEEVTYDDYRSLRSEILLTYCRAIKIKVPNLIEAVGIASEPLTESMASQDFLYVNLQEPVDREEEEALKELMEELDILQSATLTAVKGKAVEFPVPFRPHKPSFIPPEAFGMNRAARRALAKQDRRKKPRK